MSEIESRLMTLEKNNSRLRIMAVALFGIIASTALLGAAPKKAANQDEQPATDEVRAKRLVIVDDEGKERIVLEVAEKKFNTEVKTDKRKEVFATIRLLSSEGTEQASLDATDSGFARLKLFNDDGKRRIEAVTGPDGFAKVLIYDANGKEVANRFP